MRLECVGKWRHLKGFSLLCSGAAIRQSVHVFIALFTRLPMFGNQTFSRSSDLVSQDIDGPHGWARLHVFVGFSGRLRGLPDVLNGNTSSIFSSGLKSAVSTDRRLIASASRPFGLPRLQFARSDYFASLVKGLRGWWQKRTIIYNDMIATYNNDMHIREDKFRIKM